MAQTGRADRAALSQSRGRTAAHRVGADAADIFCTAVVNLSNPAVEELYDSEPEKTLLQGLTERDFRQQSVEDCRILRLVTFEQFSALPPLIMRVALCRTTSWDALSAAGLSAWRNPKLRMVACPRMRNAASSG